MLDCSLTLHPYKETPLTIPLIEITQSIYTAAEQPSTVVDAIIYGNKSYSLQLSLPQHISIQAVRVYINDEELEGSYLDSYGSIRFSNEQKESYIFSDCYGFVEIFLDVEDVTAKLYRYYTGPIRVLVAREPLNEAVKAMVHYVYQNHEELFLEGNSKGKAHADLRDDGVQTLETQMLLAIEIARVYESSFGYFKTNSAFKLEKIPYVGPIEQLQAITPDTLRYMATHPEELCESHLGQGIQLGSRVFQPQRTLILQNRRSYNTYENRIVMGFLRYMLATVEGLQKKVEKLWNQCSKKETFDEDYVDSSYYLTFGLQESLRNGRERLNTLKDKFMQLWVMYQSVFHFTPETVSVQPAPSHIFISVPQYNQVYRQIEKWFSAGLYDFQKESYLLSIIKIPSMYEGYLLLKFISFFRQIGYTLESSSRYEYPLRRDDPYFTNTRGKNTFIFTDGHRRLTLYYQPKITADPDDHKNGIDLIRNNTLTIKEKDKRHDRSEYYTPDFLLKLEEGESARYLILDAKFSTRKTVYERHVQDLAFKYLFSISPVRAEDILMGMAVIYGKCTEDNKKESAYDYQFPQQQILPFVEIIPMMETISDASHARWLKQLYRQIIGV